MIGVEYFNVRIGFYVACRNSAFATRFYIDSLRTVAVYLEDNALKIKNNLRDILFNTGNGRKFVKYAVNFADVMAYPGREDSKTLRRLFPIVVPYPLSSGSITNLP